MTEEIILAYLIFRKNVDRYSEARRFNDLRASCLLNGKTLFFFIHFIFLTFHK